MTKDENSDRFWRRFKADRRRAELDSMPDEITLEEATRRMQEIQDDVKPLPSSQIADIVFNVTGTRVTPKAPLTERHYLHLPFPHSQKREEVVFIKDLYQTYLKK